MKKLNITKEQYNKSQYFQNKYGKLAYVSESGKLFKTSKGNLLKFNEENDEQTMNANDFIRALMEIPRRKKIGVVDGMFKDGKVYAKGIYQVDKGETKFNLDAISKTVSDETGNAEWTLEKCEFDPKSSKEDRKMDWDFGMAKVLLTFVPAKQVAESHDDLDNDPAYECPFCGSHNCEFVSAEDYPEEGYFDGSKLKTKFRCLDCDEEYDAIFNLSWVGNSSSN